MSRSTKAGMGRMPARLAALLIAGAVAAPQQGFAKPPLSASDWLSGSVQKPDTISAWRPGTKPPRDAMRDTRSDIAKTGAVEPVSVTRLGQGNPDSVGTVSPRTAGLPENLWGDSDARDLARLIQQTAPRLPALRRLLRRVLAAQLTAPITAPGDEGVLFLARTDKLLDMAATGAAKELIQASGEGNPARFRRLFDIALLSGDEAKACSKMDRTPGVAPSFEARVFCLALGGDWAAAALVFHGAEAMGQLDPEMAKLLAHFLDDSYSDSADALQPPAIVTPLALRMHEAIGQPLSSQSLPLAFALSDLDGNGGWKAQLDAAERLARAGAIPASQLRAIYVLQGPAASGGVWDRAAGIQKLADAVSARDTAAVAEALPAAFDLMKKAGLGPALADMMGAELGAMPLEGKAGQIALWLALQAGQPQVLFETSGDVTPFDAWLLALASGKNAPPPPDDPLSERAATLSLALQGPMQTEGSAVNPPGSGNQKGRALLEAISDTDAGLDGDIARAARGVSALVALNQSEIARQAVVELILTPMITGRAP